MPSRGVPSPRPPSAPSSVVRNVRFRPRVEVTSASALLSHASFPSSMNQTDIINDYVTDMAAVEKHIHDAVERQLRSDETKRHPDAMRVLSTLRDTLDGHVRALEAFNDRTPDGAVKEAVKETVAGALGVAAGFYDQLRATDKVSRMIRDSYTATGLAAISYHMLYTTALGLQADELAHLALRNLKELTPILVDLSQVICSVVATELAAEDRLIDATVADEATRATHEAWTYEHVTA